MVCQPHEHGSGHQCRRLYSGQHRDRNDNCDLYGGLDQIRLDNNCRGKSSPAVASLSPTSATVGAAAQTLTISGTGFVSSSAVTYNGVAHTATFVSTTQLTISLSVSDQATAGTYAVVVTNPSPGGGASNSSSFTVDNPVPVIVGLSPSTVAAGAVAQTLAINGTNFLSNSAVTFNGVAHAATFVSSTKLTISLSVSDQATAGNYAVVVTNPAPGGGASNSFSFTADNPAPAISGLSPSLVIAGAPAQTLTITGTNFVPIPRLPLTVRRTRRPL